MSDLNYAGQPFNRFDVPVKMGLLIGVAAAILTTANNMFVLPANYMGFLAFTFVIFAVCVVLYGVTGAQQRKAIGGYIDIKGAFQAIFIAILISSVISAVWGFVYAKYIDPALVDKIKAGTLGMMERFKLPQEKIDEAADNFDKKMKASAGIGNTLYAFAQGLIVQSLFGFICAAIVRRNPPADMR